MAAKKIRVLLVIDEAGVGGGQHHVALLASGLPADRYEAAVAVEGEGFLPEELQKRGIPVIPVWMSNRPSLSAYQQCVRAIESFEPHLLHSHGGTAGVYGRWAAHRRVPAIIHTYHGIHYLHSSNAFKRRLYAGIDRFLLRWTDRTIFVARADLELALRAGVADTARAVVIENGIDLAPFAQSEIPTWGGRSGPVIGTIGRLHAQKGQIYLLEAFPAVLRRYPGALLRFIGDGELRFALEERANALKVSGRVEFLGTRTDIPAQLAAIDVFVLPSLWEGQPLVLLEAMAACRPIVGTRVDGVVEQLTDGRNAQLVPSRSPEALASAIVAYLDDHELAVRHARSARETVYARFDANRMLISVDRLYRQVLAEKNLGV